jgi:hypothetical protein
MGLDLTAKSVLFENLAGESLITWCTRSNCAKMIFVCFGHVSKYPEHLKDYFPHAKIIWILSIIIKIKDEQKQFDFHRIIILEWRDGNDGG